MDVTLERGGLTSAWAYFWVWDLTVQLSSRPIAYNMHRLGLGTAPFNHWLISVTIFQLCESCLSSPQWCIHRSTNPIDCFDVSFHFHSSACINCMRDFFTTMANLGVSYCILLTGKIQSPRMFCRGWWAIIWSHLKQGLEGWGDLRVTCGQMSLIH